MGVDFYIHEETSLTETTDIHSETCYSTTMFAGANTILIWRFHMNEASRALPYAKRCIIAECCGRDYF